MISRSIAVGLSLAMMTAPAMTQETMRVPPGGGAAKPPAQTAPPVKAVELPDTPAGRQAKGFLEAFNTGDALKLEAFLKANYPAAINNPQYYEIQASSKGFKLVAIEASEDMKITLRVESASSGKQPQLIVAVESTPPHMIRIIGLILA